MAEQCVNGWGKGKNIYRTRAQAEKAARRTTSGLHLFTYCCKHCRQYHLTKQAPKSATEQPPSASKLRRILADRAALMASQQRRQDEVDARLKKAEESRRAAEAVYQEELVAIAAMVNRLQRV